MQNIVFTTAWCYGKNEKTKICPVCDKPIQFGEIMIDGETTVYHGECGRKKMKGEENGRSNDD